MIISTIKMLRKRVVVCIIEKCFNGSPRSARSTISRYQSSLSYLHHVGAKPLRHVPLGTTLTEAAEKWPDRPAIISRKENRSLTFSELLNEADKLAASLRALGLDKGDRLGIWMPNCTQWIVSMMAAARAELISVAINHMYGKREMQYALRKVGVKALLASGSRVSRNYYQVLTDAIPELAASKPGQLECTSLPELKNVILADDDQSSPGTLKYEQLINAAQTPEIHRINQENHLINPDSACNIQYTSGTTGDPKAPILSHQSIVNNGYVIGYRNELEFGHKKICVQVPLFHVFGVVVTISAAIQHGATMVLPSPTYSPTANLEAMLVEKCDVIHGTPTMHIDLVNAVRSRGAAGVRAAVAVTGGSPVTPQLVQDMASTLNVERVKSIFGMTEGSAVSFQSLHSEDPERPLHYLGHLHDHLEAKVVDDNNQLVPFGQPGELLIRGYSLMKGYWDDAKITKECIGEDGWLRSGDQVKLQADGYSQIMGRLKDIIIRGGENIAPKEIEDVMSTHPDVLECQVFGVEDTRLGEDVAAAVRLRDGSDVTPEALSRHVAAKLAKHKVPRIIRRVQAFPKTASGKVQKFKLRNLLESGQL